MTDRPNAGRWVAALVGITFVWGATFVVVKEAVDRLPVLVFNAWRFTIAAAVLAVFARRQLAELGRDGFRRGVVLGLALGGGYALQTFGLTGTTASKAGFVTGTFVVFTPLLQAALLRRAPRPMALAAVGVAAAGLALLSLRGSLVPSVGDALVLGCAFLFALHIVGLGAWSTHHPPAALATVQLATTAVLHIVATGIEALVRSDGYAVMPPDAFVWSSLLFTAVFASALAFTVQTAAQRVLSPTRAAVIMTMEPVFSWLTAWLGVPLLVALGVTGFAREVFGGREALGAGLILVAMLLTELRGPRAADVV